MVFWISTELNFPTSHNSVHPFCQFLAFSGRNFVKHGNLLKHCCFLKRLFETVKRNGEITKIKTWKNNVVWSPIMSISCHSEEKQGDIRVESGKLVVCFFNFMWDQDVPEGRGIEQSNIYTDSLWSGLVMSLKQKRRGNKIYSGNLRLIFFRKACFGFRGYTELKFPTWQNSVTPFVIFSCFQWTNI